MNLRVECISIILYLLSQNKENIVKSVNFTSPNEPNITVDSSLKGKPRGLEIITEGSTGPNDATKYNLRSVTENQTHYIFKKGTRCTEVRADGATVWKAKKGDFYPGAVSYYDPDEIAINFSHVLIVLYYRRGKWRPLKELLESEIESLKPPPNLNKPPIILNISSNLDSDLFSFFREENLDMFIPKEGYFFKILRQNRMIIWYSTTPNEYANAIYIASKSFALISQVNGRWKEVDFKPEPEYLNLKSNLVTLDIKRRVSTDYIKFGWYLDFDKFNARGINVINKVKNGFDTIWEPKNGKYAKKVTVRTTGIGRKIVRVFNPDDEFEDIEIKFQLVDVDIDRTKSTNEIDYESNEYSKIYTPKSGYFFKGVNEQGVEIWRSEVINDYAYKVIVRERGNIRYAYIHIDEQCIVKKYTKQGEGVPWEECL